MLVSKFRIFETNWL